MKPINQELKEAFRWKGFDWYRNFTLALIAGLAISYGVLSATNPDRSHFDLKVAAGGFALGAACILLAANRVFVLSCALMVPAALMFYSALAAGDRIALEFCVASFSIGFLVLIMGTLAQSLWRARSSRDSD
jgi:hypothetical protein